MPDQESLQVGVIQINSTCDLAANLTRAEQLVREAAGRGCQLVALPELFPRLGEFDQILEIAQPIPGDFSTRWASLAQQLGIYLVAGSMCESSPSDMDGNVYFNTSLIFAPDGSLLGKYRKVHLFEVAIPGEVTLCEADYFSAGDALAEFAVSKKRFGMAICYDLRFPELFREYFRRNVDAMIIPSAFTRVTGAAHWKTLLQARAIENQVFVIAPNQVGRHNQKLQSYGHSMIIDPWGIVLAEAGGKEEEIITATIDWSRREEVMRRIPVTNQSRVV